MSWQTARADIAFIYYYEDSSRYDVLENMDEEKQPVVKVTLTCSSGTGVKVRLRTSRH